MKVLQINSIPYGSICRIALGIQEIAAQEGIEVIFAYGFSTHPVKEIPSGSYKIGGVFNKAIHIAFSRISGLDGYLSIVATIRLVRYIKKNRFDIVHLHNIHGRYLNYPILFDFLKRNHIKVIWTQHDIWSMTGLCPNYTMVKCSKWKTGCGECPQYREVLGGYYVDNSKYMWKEKKKWFTCIPNMTIVSPSKWLSEVVKESYLSKYDVQIINNGIDTSIFKPVDSDIKTRLGINQNKYIVLGVSLDWGVRKGLDIFESLANQITDNYVIVLVGVPKEISNTLPKSIVCIERTQNQQELVEMYSCADVFVNPTREDNFPTVNLEALACGTPVITLNNGGSGEMLDDTCGRVLESESDESFLSTIYDICENKSIDPKCCVNKAMNYNMKAKYHQYVELYKKLKE